MPTLVFDIETVGERWEDFDSVTKEVLMRWVNHSAQSDVEVVAGEKDVKEGLGFSPLTGFVVALGLYDLERDQGVVYYQGDKDGSDIKIDNFVLKSRNEREILNEFWEGALNYDKFVTFNGRRFDLPFLLHRSVALEVKPTVDLMTWRYLSQQKTVQHIDLQEQLTFYGAMQRRPSLHLFCRAFGIKSPKSEGVTGDSVASLYELKQFQDIAHYNRDDVLATAELYKKWLQFLAPDDEFENDIIN